MDPYTDSFSGGYWSVNPYVSTEFRETRQATGRALPVVPRTGLCGRVMRYIYHVPMQYTVQAPSSSPSSQTHAFVVS